MLCRWLLSETLGRGKTLFGALQQAIGLGQCGFANVGFSKWMTYGFLGAQSHSPVSQGCIWTPDSSWPLLILPFSPCRKGMPGATPAPR